MIPGFISHRERYRQDVLFNLIEKNNPVILTTSLALEENDIPAISLMEENHIFIKLGEKFNMDTAIKKIIDFGYEKVDTVIDPGSYCRKGDLIDIYPPHFVFPVRFSFNFDTIDRIAYFDPATQLTTKNIQTTNIKGLTKNTQHINNIGLKADFSTEEAINKVADIFTRYAAKNNNPITTINPTFYNLKIFV